ncbi:MAG: polysaccharide biosynthesis tyrosine autokinase [Clostridia bacterium]
MARDIVEDIARNKIKNKKEIKAKKEFFKMLKANIEFALAASDNKCIIVTSPEKRDGKTYVAVNIAKEFAEEGYNCCILDLDIVNGVQKEIFSAKKEEGIADIIADEKFADINYARENINSFMQETDIDNLQLVTAGVFRKNTEELLSKKALSNVLEVLNESLDYIFVDALPVDSVLGSLKAFKGQNVILVTREDKLCNAAVTGAADALKKEGATVIGTTCNEILAEVKKNPKKPCKKVSRFFKNNIKSIKKMFQSIEEKMDSIKENAQKRKEEKEILDEVLEDVEEVENEVNIKPSFLELLKAKIHEIKSKEDEEDFIDFAKEVEEEALEKVLENAVGEVKNVAENIAEEKIEISEDIPEVIQKKEEEKVEIKEEVLEEKEAEENDEKEENEYVVAVKKVLNNIYVFGIKRVLDFCIALVSLIVLSPIFFCIALCIKREGKGNGKVFFSQARIGRFGKKINVYKFRTMDVKRVEEEKEFTQKGDSSSITKVIVTKKNEITKIGQFLRRYALDDLPQLVNVVKGEMSLVGPRPANMQQVSFYNEEDKKRFKVMPGMSGISKSMDPIEKLNKDVWYAENISMLLDLKIIFNRFSVKENDGVSKEEDLQILKERYYNETCKIIKERTAEVRKNASLNN